MKKFLIVCELLLSSVAAFAFEPDKDFEKDRILLDETQKACIDFAWKGGDPTSGLAYETTEKWNTGTHPATVGGTGFAIMSFVVGVERGWIPRPEAVARIVKIATFLRDKTARASLHGAFPHWIEGSTGESLKFSKELGIASDIVETAYLMEGLLIARRYFNKDGEEAHLRELITGLWNDIDWKWYTNNEENGLYWHWDPEQGRGFKATLKILGFNECQIAYILALASPTKPISAQAARFWSSGSGYQTKVFLGYKLQASLDDPGPMFLAHYSYMAMDPRRIADTWVNNGYMVRNITQTLINHSYCLYEAPKANGYSEVLWGLTACRTPGGYEANSPAHDSGTIAPTAALSSIPYTPYYSLQMLRNLAGPLRAQIWGIYGPYDAYNPSRNWVTKDIFLGIDTLPIVCMIENYRSGLLWRLFMEEPLVQKALDTAGLHEPRFDVGFPEMVVPNHKENGRWVPDACDLVRHPDRGVYEVPYWTKNATEASFELREKAGTVLLTTVIHTVPGRNVLSFPQLIPGDGRACELTMTVEGKKYTVPVRMH